MASEGTRSRRSDRARRCFQTIWFCPGTHPSSGENVTLEASALISPSRRKTASDKNLKLPIRQVPAHGQVTCTCYCASLCTHARHILSLRSCQDSSNI